MNELLDDDDARRSPRGDRELTLNTGAILGIFLALVLLCGACFGFGYNLGRKSLPTPLALSDGSTDALGNNTDSTGLAKPSAGSPTDTAAPPPTVATPAPKPAPVLRKPPPVTPPVTAEDADSSPAEARTATTVPSAPVARAVPPSALMPSASAGAAGSIMVQVAAVSHREDADLLVGALRGRGYTVAARPAASDGFIHVQVGPFSDKKDAEAMRQRLIADGYNAILK